MPSILLSTTVLFNKWHLSILHPSYGVGDQSNSQIYSEIALINEITDLWGATIFWIFSCHLGVVFLKKNTAQNHLFQEYYSQSMLMHYDQLTLNSQKEFWISSGHPNKPLSTESLLIDILKRKNIVMRAWPKCYF